MENQPPPSYQELDAARREYKQGPGNDAELLRKMFELTAAKTPPLTEQQQKDRLLKACAEGRAGISRTTHFVVHLDDEPDAIPIPYSSVFDPLKQSYTEAAGPAKEAKPKVTPIRTGSNYTPPKKKRKKRSR